jgi:hypothetical protein
MRSSPLALSDKQITALHIAAKPLPLRARWALLQLVAGFCFEADAYADDYAFRRALDRAIDKLSASTEDASQGGSKSLGRRPLSPAADIAKHQLMSEKCQNRL